MATQGQIDAFARAWAASKTQLNAVLAVFVGDRAATQSLRNSVEFVDLSIPEWRSGKTSDSDFIDIVNYVINDAADLYGKASTSARQNALEAYTNAIPSVLGLSDVVDVTGEGAEIKAKPLPKSLLALGVLVIVGIGLYYGAQTQKETAELEEKMRRTKPMNKEQFRDWLAA